VKAATAILTTLGLVAIAAGVGAQQTGFKRTVLQQSKLSIPGHESVTAIAEFQPGGTVGRHTHPGEEIGYVLEGYDSLGRRRTEERVYDEQSGRLLATLPVDTTAVPRVNLDDARPVSGPAELNQRIVDSGKVEACVAKNYFSFAVRRTPVANSGDACAVDVLRVSLGTPGMGLADAFKRLAQQPAFRRRRIATP
jgi:hypothetical protein